MRRTPDGLISDVPVDVISAPCQVHLVRVTFASRLFSI